MKHNGALRLTILVSTGTLDLLEPKNMRPVLRIAVPPLSWMAPLGSSSTTFLSSNLLTVTPQSLLITNLKQHIGKALMRPVPTKDVDISQTIPKPQRKGIFQKAHGIAVCVGKGEKDLPTKGQDDQRGQLLGLQEMSQGLKGRSTVQVKSRSKASEMSEVRELMGENAQLMAERGDKLNKMADKGE